MKHFLFILMMTFASCNAMAQDCTYIYVGPPYSYREYCCYPPLSFCGWTNNCSYSGSSAMQYPCFADFSEEQTANLKHQSLKVRLHPDIPAIQARNINSELIERAVQLKSRAILNSDGSVSFTLREESDIEISITAVDTAAWYAPKMAQKFVDYCAPWHCNENGCIRTCVTECNGYTTQFKPSPSSPDPQEICN